MGFYRKKRKKIPVIQGTAKKEEFALKRSSPPPLRLAFKFVYDNSFFHVLEKTVPSKRSNKGEDTKKRKRRERERGEKGERKRKGRERERGEKEKGEREGGREKGGERRGEGGKGKKVKKRE
jgi:hypothetical protein